MSADIVWSVIRNNSSNLFKKSDKYFSTRSVDGTHRRYTHNYGRNNTGDVIATKKGVKVVVTKDGKTTSQYLKKDRSKTVIKALANVNNAIINKAVRKARVLKRARVYKKRAHRNVAA